MKKYSMDIANAINVFLKDDDWNYSFDEKEGTFKFGLSTRGRIKKLNYLIRVHDDDYIVYTFSPIGADHDNPEMMMKMSELVCRANYGIKNGNFELDFRDGEIRYKTYVDCDGGAVPTREIVKGSIYCPASMFDRYGVGITEMIFGETTAKEAIAKCEGDLEEYHETEESMGTEINEDSESMMERLAARLGMSEKETAFTEEPGSILADAINPDTLTSKGGAA